MVAHRVLLFPVLQALWPAPKEIVLDGVLQCRALLWFLSARVLLVPLLLRVQLLVEVEEVVVFREAVADF
jgi:hypothetical protein